MIVLKRNILLLLAVVLQGILPAYAYYTMEDLQSLENRGAFQEFLSHAKDIRPSSRDGRWQSMLENVAESYIRELATKSLYTLDHWNSVESLAQWPELKNVELLQFRRFEYGLGHLKNCFEKNSDKSLCQNMAQSMWANTTMRERLASQSVSFFITLKRHAPQLARWEHLTFGLLAPSSEFACQKEEIQQAILMHFQEPVAQDTQSKKLLAMLDDSLAPECWAKLVEPFQEMLFHPSVLVRETAWGLLNAKNNIPEKTRDLFLVHYVLNDPAVGPIFNLAWSAIRRLGSDFKQRGEILSELAKLDPLPDSLLSSSDPKKIKTVMSHINHHMPEYVTLYLGQCQAFLQGTQEFHQGNPTKHCREMVKLLKQQKYVMPMQFSKLEELLLKRKSP